MSAPGRKRLERSPSRSKGQSPTATSRENKIEDQEPPITALATATKATCGKEEEGSKKPAQIVLYTRRAGGGTAKGTVLHYRCYLTCLRQYLHVIDVIMPGTCIQVEPEVDRARYTKMYTLTLHLRIDRVVVRNKQ